MPGMQGLSAWPRMRRWALAASVLWAVVVVGYGAGFLTVAAAGTDRGTLFIDAMFFLLALTMPLVLFWLAALLAEELEKQRALTAALAEAAAPLAAALGAARPDAALGGAGVSAEEMRSAVQSAVSGLKAPDLGRPLDRLIIGQSRIEASLMRLLAQPRASLAASEETVTPPPPARSRARAPAAPADPAPEDKPAEGRPDWPDLVRALDFPRDADDQAGFKALKDALRYPALAQMLQAAEDVLTLLSQEGIYVDELPMDPVDPAAWRRFVAGVRGAEVTAVGGIRDNHALETARQLTASDSIFRDSALFFQRRFDSVLSDVAGTASDAQLIELAGTRSGRAFMLLARLNGALD